MMFDKILYVIFILLPFTIYSQITDSLNAEVEPFGGINKLALKFYGIEFTKPQRKILEDKEIEMIFEVDEYGLAKLSEINGILDKDILDSLKIKSLTLEKFQPRVVNGVAQTSLYFLKMKFSSYKMTAYQLELLRGKVYNETKMENFEYILKSGRAIDVTLGGMGIQFFGKPDKYLSFGGGMRAKVCYSDGRKNIYGIQMGIYSNKLKNSFPLNTSKVQIPFPTSLQVGLTFGKCYKGMAIEVELNQAIMNLTERESTNDKNWIQLKGWSPGIILNYPLTLGKEKAVYYYGSPTVFTHKLNFHFGLRYLKLNLKEASGPLLEIGAAYKMFFEHVKEYKIRD